MGLLRPAVSSPGLLGGFGSWAAVRHHKHNLPHLGKLTIRVAINRNVNALDDAANLATMRAMMNIHIRLPRCLGLWAEIKRSEYKDTSPSSSSSRAVIGPVATSLG
jgi:hypothetical protein